jgi:DNA-binding transcriptional LysR family regulator
MLALADAAPDLARRVSDGHRGMLRIGFTATSAIGTLGGLLDTLDRLLPGVDLDLHEMVTHDQIRALEGEEIDLGLARPPFDADVFGSRLLHREALVLAVPAAHRLAVLDRPATTADIAGEPLLMHSPTRARYFYDLVIATLQIDHRNVVHRASQILTMLWLVSAGRGLAFVPASARRLGIPGVAYVPLRTSVPEPVELHLLWPRESRNPVLTRVVELLAQET